MVTNFLSIPILMKLNGARVAKVVRRQPQGLVPPQGRGFKSHLVRHSFYVPPIFCWYA